MGRSTNANNANTTYGNQSTAANAAETADIGKYNANEATLASGRNVGADPFQSTSYLANQNKLQSESLNTSADSAKAAMARRSLATGGINGSQAILGQRDIGLQTGRLADTLSAERAAGDYKSNLAYQQYLAQAPLNAAAANQGMYSTATGGQGNALNNLTQLSGQQYGFWGGLAGAAMQGAGTGAGLAAACWIAMALWGDFAPKTLRLRRWLNEIYSQTFPGNAVMWLYRRVGQSVARQVRKRAWVGNLLRPLFEMGNRAAANYYKEAC